MGIPEAKMQPTTVDVWKVDYEEQLPKVQKNINELRDDETKNGKEVKENLDKSLTANFLKGIKEFLDKQENGQRKSDLEESIKVVLYKHRKDENFNKEYESLISLATALGVEWDNDESADKNGKSKGEITINWSIDEEIDKLEKWKTTKEHFYENGKRVEKIPDWVNGEEGFDKKIQWKLEDLTPLISEGGKFKDNENLKSMEESLKKIQEILKNPTVSNVQLLQKYIYDNLSEDDKKEFGEKNKYSKKTEFDWKFDWKFWDSTKEWLEKLLTKMDDYIKQLEGTENNENEWGMDGVKQKENINADKNSDPETWLDNLPNGAKVDFFDETEKEKLNNLWEQEIKLKVEVDGNTKEITVKVNVVENADNQSQPSLDTTPLNLGTSQHLVMRNSSTIAQNAGLNWATFYFGEGYNGEHPAEWQSWNQAEIPANWQDYICYMKLSNRPSELYKVKVDKDWNLCPVATKTDNKLKSKDWSSLEESVLFKNNPSCIDYLKNKLPDEIKEDCKIWWVNSKNDYTLQSYGRTLTIEPMTIAWDWVCKDNENNPNYLSKCLAFINLTNYIRSLWDNYGNKNPDINSDLKVKGIKINWKKVHINKDALWLRDATDDEILRFKKYNNHEDWRDNWDKKGPNRNYKKVDFPNVKVEWQVSVHPQKRTPQLDSSTRVAGQATSQLGGGDGQRQIISESIRDNEGTGFYLKPKAPIYGMENEWAFDGRNWGLEWIWAFDGKGNFKFQDDVQEHTVWDKTIIKIGEKEFTKIDSKNGKWITIESFTWNWYQIGKSWDVNWFFIWEYNDEIKSLTWRRVFENGAHYEWQWGEGMENWSGIYSYANWDVYEWQFKNGKLEWKWTYTWAKKWIKYTWDFKDDEITKWKFVINFNWQETSYEVENDGNWLKVSLDNVEGNEDNEGIYISTKKWNNWDWNWKENPATSTNRPWSERAQEIAQKLKAMGFNAEVVEMRTT